MMFGLGTWIFALLLTGAGRARDLAVTSPPASSQKAEAAGASTHGNKKKKGRRVVKDTEGTEAPDRFETDTVIKSQYELNGQQLEVDTD